MATKNFDSKWRSKLFYFFKKKSAGFTLIELIVVLFIMTLVSSVVLANYGSFRQSTSVLNLANEVALSIRQAQVFGVAVVGEGIGQAAVFPRYGVRIGYAPGEYSLFHDLDADNAYDDPGELVETFILPNGGSLSACTIDASAVRECGELLIIFVRPNPDAFIYRVGAGALAFPEAEIEIEINGQAEQVAVLANGQIAIR